MRQQYLTFSHDQDSRPIVFDDRAVAMLKQMRRRLLVPCSLLRRTCSKNSKRLRFTNTSERLAQPYVSRGR